MDFLRLATNEYAVASLFYIYFAMYLQGIGTDPYVICSTFYIMFTLLRENMDRRKNASVKLLSFHVGLGCFFYLSLHALWLLELISTSISFLDALPGICSQIAQCTVWDSLSIFFGRKLFGYIVLLATAFAVPAACYFFYLSTAKKWFTFFLIISSVHYCLTGSKLAELGRKWIHPQFTDYEMLYHLTPAIINFIALCMSTHLCGLIYRFEGYTYLFVYSLLWNVYSFYEFWYSQEMESIWDLHKKRWMMPSCAIYCGELGSTTIITNKFIHHSDCCNECGKCKGLLSAERTNNRGIIFKPISAHLIHRIQYREVLM